MSFCTAVNCMDGRVQKPVIRYLRSRFRAKYVDMITEPGPNRLLAEHVTTGQVESILARIDISVEKHGSKGLAIVGPHDCAGNPTEEDIQLDHLKRAAWFLRDRYPGIRVIALWIDHRWGVNEIEVP